jgi:hypothetical protein
MIHYLCRQRGGNEKPGAENTGRDHPGKDPTMTESQYRTIESLGLDPGDNTEFLTGFDSPEIAIEWFLGAGRPADWPEATDDERDALAAYVAQ